MTTLTSVVKKNLKQKTQYIDEKKELKDKIGIMPVISFDECDNIDYKKIAENHIDNNFISNDISMGRISG